MKQDPGLFRASSLVVLELQTGLRAGETFVQLTVSIKGREGTLRRSWRLTEGRPSSGQLADLSHYVASLVTAAVVTSTGAQESLLPGLPLEESEG